MTTIIGIDFSGAKSDRNTWVAHGQMTSDGALEFDGANMIRRKDVVNLLMAVSTPTIAAIDFPFGLPREFADFLNAGSDLNTMPDVWRIIDDMSLENFYAARDAFVGRFGEPKRAGDAAHFSESYSPLHKVNPNMLPMTYWGIRMLHRLYTDSPDRWAVPPIPAARSQAQERNPAGNDARRFSQIYRRYPQGIQEAQVHSNSATSGAMPSWTRFSAIQASCCQICPSCVMIASPATTVLTP